MPESGAGRRSSPTEAPRSHQFVDLGSPHSQAQQHPPDARATPEGGFDSFASFTLPSRLPKDRPVASGSSSGLVERLLPADPVGDDVQQPLCGGHVVVVAGGDGFPGVAGRVGCRKAEGLGQPVLAVGAVVGEGLAGPLAGDQHAAAGVAEVFAAVGLALAARRGACPAGRSWAGRRSGASSRRSASTARSAARRRAGRRGAPGRRCRPGGSRRRAWSGTWSGSRCTGSASCDPARTPWASNRSPNRATCSGSSSSPMASSAWSQVGRTSPVAGSR